MILRVRGRIRRRIGGCWGWCRELDEGFYTEFTESAEGTERKETGGASSASSTCSWIEEVESWKLKVERKRRN